MSQNLKVGDRVHYSFDGHGTVHMVDRDGWVAVTPDGANPDDDASEVIGPVGLFRSITPHLGDFDATVEYPRGTVVVNDIKPDGEIFGITAILTSVGWRVAGRTTVNHYESPTVDTWENPQVIYMPAAR